MRLILWAEWLRFRRSRANLAITFSYCLVLAVCALWSMQGARDKRLADDREIAAQHAVIEQARASHPAGGADAPVDPGRAALQAFNLGRSTAGLAQLPPGPGLALSLSPYGTLPTRIAVSVESRQADGRRSDALSNPMLAQYRALDLGAVLALLLPLVAIGLCAGAFQEDRERGIWRTTLAQTVRPWRPPYAALGIRALVLWLPAALTCSVAIAASASAGAASAAAWWALCLAAYAGFWVALCGALAALAISSGAALLTALAGWLLLTFVVPAGLQTAAGARHPMPSRLAFIVELRQAQQEAEVRMPALTKRWYANHPESAPLFTGRHTWPVTFLPRFEHQDSLIHPALRRFDRQRLAQTEFVQRWAWLSPPLALLQVSDDLAGIGAGQHSAFLDAVDTYEATWRGFFVPRIMSYRGLSSADYARIPSFEAAQRAPSHAVAWLAVQLLVAAAALTTLLHLLRKRLGRCV
ncbi:DUF3526 domain-containing protein [Bordetella genomosp. 5]|uniref:ABC transporter permease n=1 Tax=Bordetella genomosp. 5 TaxID=1395608 RepID=A0A261TTL8_9BORD|nr:DUF3526 domain-containing protein [Bordetella genomosp. 5]OZI51983.1 hypothetical protein CAL25_10780 [Bordetella genomosp. 5]